ncbi:MAG TPA: TIGR00282 family metallophosphoesterase [Terriglobia bacterium]|nr:TIGR00282 family metallophosphoesterase [Terriglobia bacterium]HVB28182.1 TIGR00282 family metallophosphoesterase [Terriglobia bacterium]
MQDTVRILYIGDIFGRPGRSIVKERLPELVSEYAPDLVLANGENAAAGFGITPKLVDELLGLGIAVLTTGNHIWDKKEIFPYLAEHADGPLLRPANYPPQVPGRGLYVGRTRAGLEYAVMNLQGRVFMPSIDCPFRSVDALLEGIPESVKIRFVDMHAEATSEKLAMGWHLDGRVTAMVGTHTHVPTADERVMPGGTAYITDLGMTGPYESVIGIDKDTAIRKFLSQLPERFEVAKGAVRLCGVLVVADVETGRAISIERVVRNSAGE